MKKYTGSCHCGAVTFEFEADIASLMECNCSHCSKKGLLLAFTPREKFTTRSGEENNLTEYRFNKKQIAHQFCSICGVQPFAYGADQNGTETACINARCIDDIDLEALPRTPFNGKDY